MDKAQAIHAFWSSFGLPAWNENSVPSGSQMPYITYSVSNADFGESVILRASLHYNSLSWADITQKADAIGKHIGIGGVLVGYDGGKLWLKRGKPFSEDMADQSDTAIRRIALNIEAEFLSED